MILSRESQIVRVPPRSLYKAACDYPMFVDFFAHKEVLHSDERELAVRVGMRRFNRLILWEGVGIKAAGSRIDFRQTKGLLKGVAVEWRFDDIGGGASRITITSSMPLSALNPIKYLIAKTLVPATTRKIIQALDGYATRQAHAVA